MSDLQYIIMGIYGFAAPGWERSISGLKTAVFSAPAPQRYKGFHLKDASADVCNFIEKNFFFAWTTGQFSVHS
jgi:hypothetical protein